MARPGHIELGDRRHPQRLPILYEDRSVIAIDKPPGWMLVPFSWQRTGRNLQAAITSSIAAGDYWARSRNLRFLRHVHRLDADTSGILLLGRSMGAVDSFSALFESRRMEKTYLAVVHGRPREVEWTCRLRLMPDANQIGRMRVDARKGKDSETRFRVVHATGQTALLEAKPLTGRTHQIRVHLEAAELPIVGDELYGDAKRDASVDWDRAMFPLALRAVALAYRDPFTRREVRIAAPRDDFLRAFGLAGGSARA